MLNLLLISVISADGRWRKSGEVIREIHTWKYLRNLRNASSSFWPWFLLVALVTLPPLGTFTPSAINPTTPAPVFLQCTTVSYQLPLSQCALHGATDQISLQSRNTLVCFRCAEFWSVFLRTVSHSLCDKNRWWVCYKYIHTAVNLPWKSQSIGFLLHSHSAQRSMHLCSITADCSMFPSICYLYQSQRSSMWLPDHTRASSMYGKDKKRESEREKVKGKI